MPIVKLAFAAAALFLTGCAGSRFSDEENLATSTRSAAEAPEARPAEATGSASSSMSTERGERPSATPPPGGSKQPAPAAAPSSPAKRVTRQTAPAMWEIADDDSKLYIFGTFHILPPDLEWKTISYEIAMEDAEKTVTEADTESAEAVASLGAAIREVGLNPEGVALSDTLGPERFARFAAAAQQFGLAPQALESYRPWLAMITVSVAAIQAQGYDAAAGVDGIVTSEARDEGDDILHLETASEQVRILASLDEDEMLANFDVTLEQLENFDTMAAEMLEAWRTGDEDKLAAIFVADLKASSPDAFEKILAARNRNWAEQAVAFLADDEDYFIAVGAGHLVGEDSLIDLLERRGLKARRIQ